MDVMKQKAKVRGMGIGIAIVVVLLFLIFNPRETARPGQSVPSHGSQGAGHVAFAVPEEEISGWRTYLEKNGIEIEADVIWPGGGRSLYIRDPAHNSVELTSPSIWGIDNST